MRVPYDEIRGALANVLVRLGFTPDRAAQCAALFADSSRDGVYSHGLNRFPRFVATVRNGVVDVDAEPGCVARLGAFERWDGRHGPGNLNASAAMARAIALAREHGVGAVALANTNHWMRGGSYGWQAADAGAVGICWTNTLANLPPYGALDPRIGNNPFVVAVPRARGHVVLDMALSQFSVGALASYRSRGERLPVAGGYDADGNLTCDPSAIEMSGRLLPIGFWKGSGLSIVLDLIGALLSGGHATWQITADPERETDLSQVFVAFDLTSIAGAELANRVADAIIDHVGVRYPGERTLETRRRNLAEGVPVEPSIWRDVQELAA